MSTVIDAVEKVIGTGDESKAVYTGVASHEHIGTDDSSVSSDGQTTTAILSTVVYEELTDRLSSDELRWAFNRSQLSSVLTNALRLAS